MEIDRSGSFWQQDAGKKAAKKKLDAPTAFAGLLLFDLLCLSAARRMSRTALARTVTFEKKQLLFEYWSKQIQRSGS